LDFLGFKAPFDSHAVGFFSAIISTQLHRWNPAISPLTLVPLGVLLKHKILAYHLGSGLKLG